jgi:eukaryotic-like serine/threonine-protein kinase
MREQFMSVPADASELAQLVVRVGLIDDQIAKECLYELDGDQKRPDELTKLMERKGLLTPLQSGKLLKGEMDGFILGGYRLLYKIASGSFGRVYRGDNPSTGQIVAIKVLRRRWTEDKKRIEMFEREGRIGMSLTHPNIVQILAVSKDNLTGQYYIVMEFVEGGNLRDILTIRKKLDPIESVRVIEECAAGLAHAHSRGLSHRDIKPTNILISTEKTAKLVDFGLAEINSGAALMTTKKPMEDENLDEVERTIDYAGLEKLTGCKKGDPRSDIYFLGIVLFEMLTSHKLLPRTKDKLAVMMKQRYDLDETISKLSRDYSIPAPIGGLLARMCAFDPASRYQSPAIMHEAIKGVQTAMTSNDGGSKEHQASGPLTVFVVEDHEKLQDVFRKTFKKHGFRVLMSIDPAQAVNRFKQQPFHAVIIDCGTVGKDGVDAFERIQKEAEQLHLKMGAVLILNPEQAAWAANVKVRDGGQVLVRPVTMKQITRPIREHLGIVEQSDDEE